MITQSQMLQPRMGTMIAICTPSSDLVEKALLQADNLPRHTLLLAPYLSPELARLAKDAGASVTSALPGLQAEQFDLISYSMPGVFSLGPLLPALRALMPGLQETDRSTVDRLDVAQLGAMIRDLPSPLHIMIDLPGIEAEAIKALAEVGALDRTATLDMRCGVEAFFDGADSAEEITHSLTALDFVLERQNVQDPDWPVLRFSADPVGRENRRLRTACEIALAERDAARAEAVSARARLAERDAEHSRMRGTLEQVRTDLDAARAEAVSAQARLAERDAELSGMRGTLEQIRTDLGAERVLLAAVQAERDGARADLAVALRLQHLAQGDLRELQSRFADVERQRRQQAELLRKLAPRLLLAADQLSHMVALPSSEKSTAGLPVVHLSQLKKNKKSAKSKKAKR